MKTTEKQIESLHATYCRLTGFQLSRARGLFDYRQRAWCDFLSAGFTEDDLALVITWLQRKIKAGERNIGAIRFSNLIEALPRFEEELGMARAEVRNTHPAPTAKERAVQAFRPTIAHLPPNDTAKPIGFWIEQLRQAAR